MDPKEAQETRPRARLGVLSRLPSEPSVKPNGSEGGAIEAVPIRRGTATDSP